MQETMSYLLRAAGVPILPGVEQYRCTYVDTVCSELQLWYRACARCLFLHGVKGVGDTDCHMQVALHM